MIYGTRFEISTVGANPNAQLVGTDPYRSPYSLGLFVPPTPPPNGSRYLFLLAVARFNAHEKARLVGMRQFVTIGQNLLIGEGLNATSYPLELQVTSPYWSFNDGNISWHVRRVPPLSQPLLKGGGGGVINGDGLQFQYGTTPALLFQNAPGEVGGYVPPYGGQPIGNVLVPDLATFHDIRFPWRSDHAWFSLDVEIEGPCDIALFASVKQTNIQTRVPLTLTGNVPLDILTDEDAFIAQNGTTGAQVGPAPNAVYRRIAGSLIFEQNNQYAIPQPIVDPIFQSAVAATFTNILCGNPAGNGQGYLPPHSATPTVPGSPSGPSKSPMMPSGSGGKTPSPKKG